ncbi:L-isoaspartyl protein carboxyl methyltransferase family protein [Besnoitia besnoiti]|uniref:protein-L-isoaspartate(D-aspartate) O-methyltransferase n=1 Tax=Besnoitia besnoiti TaxID=94643 RepID=A0A2A9MIZ1_BESBE|nr:L-isoaspartyl protein carboxyl methyltransferase family protein [Besnoitia besnoiti]PFH35936.1 L-isoaspartyl protein carboxyl methyltransferase family protein [Besnoitia besnoiti]
MPTLVDVGVCDDVSCVESEGYRSPAQGKTDVAHCRRAPVKFLQPKAPFRSCRRGQVACALMVNFLASVIFSAVRTPAAQLSATRKCVSPPRHSVRFPARFRFFSPGGKLGRVSSPSSPSFFVFAEAATPGSPSFPSARSTPSSTQHESAARGDEAPTAPARRRRAVLWSAFVSPSPLRHLLTAPAKLHSAPPISFLSSLPLLSLHTASRAALPRSLSFADGAQNVSGNADTATLNPADSSAQESPAGGAPPLEASTRPSPRAEVPAPQQIKLPRAIRPGAGSDESEASAETGQAEREEGTDTETSFGHTEPSQGQENATTSAEDTQKKVIMAWRCSGSSNEELVDNLRRSRVIRSDRVYETMKAVDRGKFIRSCPYLDSPQPLGISSATISAPHMHAAALEALKDQLVPGNRALDVGSGSGYLTVCMAHMVGVRGAGASVVAGAPEGYAAGVDYIPELVQYSEEKVKAAYPELLQNPRFRLRVGDGWRGYAEGGPYDAIHVGAAASAIPKELLAQLRRGGKMVIPVETDADGHVRFEDEVEAGAGQGGGAAGVGFGFNKGRDLFSVGQTFVEVTKNVEGNVKVKKLMGVMYVPLVKQSKPHK